MGNRIRTTVLLAVLTAFILWVGQLIGGRQGVVIALVLAAGMNFFSYWFSDKVVLRMVRARQITPEQSPDLHRLVAQLARKAGLPTPRVYLIPEESPNAFATGRNPEHAVVAVTQGLLDLMDREELTGVLAHELGHVKNRDILIGSVAATLAGAVMVLASMARWSALFGGTRGSDDERGGVLGLVAVSILAPLAAVVIQMAISRTREYLADRTAARISGQSAGLARALEKLGTLSGRIPMNVHPSAAHMFIVNPLAGRRLAALFSTHPPIEERVARLRGGAGRPGPPPGGDHRQAEGRAFWDRLR
jgi:heat shock protein HtpX